MQFEENGFNDKVNDAGKATYYYLKEGDVIDCLECENTSRLSLAIRQVFEEMMSMTKEELNAEMERVAREDPEGLESLHWAINIKR